MYVILKMLHSNDFSVFYDLIFYTKKVYLLRFLISALVLEEPFIVIFYDVRYCTTDFVINNHPYNVKKNEYYFEYTINLNTQTFIFY